MKKRNVSTVIGFIIITVTAIIIFGGVLVYQYYYVPSLRNSIESPEVNQAAGWKTYTNSEYGFRITFPDSWKGYAVEKKYWDGVRLDSIPSEGPDYSGPLFIFKNPKTTSNQAWQDIPIMVFTPDVWKLISEEKVSVSAAPIGPAKIGENSKYVFATPPRWYGFADAIGWQEAIEIVKTFKAY